MKKVKAILCIGILAISLVHSQERKLKQAEKRFEDYAFIAAAKSYEALAEKGYSEQRIYESLGNANYLNAKYSEASEWYGKLLELEGAEVEKEYLYRYAQALKSTGNYLKSDEIMQRFYSAKTPDNRALLYAQRKDYLKSIEKNSGRIKLDSLTINSAVSDFSPAFYKEALVFSSARDTGITTKNIHAWDKGAFLNLFVSHKSEQAGFGTVEKFSKVLNSKTHESSAVFTADGNTVYFTRNNSRRNKFKRDKNGISRLTLLRAELVNGEWTNPIALPFNDDSHSVAHPALSTDEKTLYFSSDMPGTLGASDIFKVAIKANGTYGEPINLGPTINTESRETFPFVLEETIYFASDGHPGLGGLDVFAAKLDGSSKQVLNLGKPLNSMQDDFSYIMDKKGAGYFASNRPAGKGGDDIYGFVEKEPLSFTCISGLKGKVEAVNSEIPLSNAKISVIDGSGNILNSTTSATDGAFGIPVDCSKGNLQLVVNKEGYFGQKIAVAVVPGQTQKLIAVLTQEEKMLELPKEGKDVLAHLGLQPILFDLNSAEIRQDAQGILREAGQYLTEHPNLKVDIRSHTDTKASRKYNIKLSQARAKATFGFLVALGVNKANLNYKAYGESSLRNDCTNWSNCSDRENEMNRRSELIVVATD